MGIDVKKENKIFKTGVGKSDFADLRTSGAYYVDKTEMLYELAEVVGNEVSLFTRPRRFGKTLMLSMMENFFNVRKDSKEIFEGLDICKHKAFCEKWMNKYPVVFISFKDVDALEFEDAYDMLKSIIADFARSISDVDPGDGLNQYDKEAFLRLQAGTSALQDIKNSLKLIMKVLSAVYNKKVILLIDEYDVPLAKASERDTSENNYYKKMLDIIRVILSTALKDNEFLKFAVITGCLRIAKESIFTGTNNFASYSVIDKKFSEYYGFTETEVSEMLAAADRSEKAEIIKEWYNGYIFGDSAMYCPWDVINYLSALRDDRDAKPKNYWKNTSHNGILLTFVKRTEFSVRGKFETLLNGGTIVQSISDELTYDMLHASEENLWSVLLMTGYITKADPNEDYDSSVTLKIPNKEIATIFEDTVVWLFRETLDKNVQLSMTEALWGGNEDEAGKCISALLKKTISYNDYHENYYHAFIAGIFTGLGYEVESNKEKGLGRPDMVVKDYDNDRAMVIETKRSIKKEDMEEDCEAALGQIRDKEYDTGFDDFEKVMCYGVAFYQKQARVKLMGER